MKVVKQSHEWIYKPVYADALKVIETACRNCYKSEDRIGDNTAEPLIRKVIANKHHSCLEHIQLTVRLVCSRSISHEIVRHRLCSYSQTSTRFVDYDNKEIEFIQPSWVTDECLSRAWDQLQAFKDAATDFNMMSDDPCYNAWRWIKSLHDAEVSYKELRTRGLAPQFARGVFSQDLKTEIIMSANLREWRHIFALRICGISGPPHPDIKALFLPMLEDLWETYPVFFEDIENG